MKRALHIRHLFYLMALMFSQFTLAIAQKLPKVQTVGVWAPADIKIDGQATEWNDQFRAHNYGNHIYYTISNDDKNLYLTAQMDDNEGNKKILKGGLTFTIVSSEKKESNIAITFPLTSKAKREAMEDGGDSRLLDSLKSAVHGEITKDYREVYVTGIPEISDPLLSIYNTRGIKVGAALDKKKRYTYELAIPLKYLVTAVGDAKNIRYNIRLNVLPVNTPKKVSTGPIDVVTFPSGFHAPSIDDLFRYEDSDFSGAYTLAVKP